jgi:spore coat protein H
MPLLRLAVCVLFISSPLFAQQPKDPTEEIFKPGAVHVFKINFSDEELKKIKSEPRKYCKCTITIGDVKLEEVAIHLKGAAGSFRNFDDKPALTINLDKFKSGQNFKGLDKFHLNNSVQDGSFMNEIMYSEIALKLGIPTARSAHAIVELNGRKMGLYVLKEGYDSAFVKRNFPKATGGNLYDGGFLMDIDNKDLKLNDGPGNDKKDLQAIVKACQIQDAKKRWEEVSKLVDVDLFCADTAMQLIFCDWDGYMRNRNNYRLYCPPNGGKAVFVPHGKDQLLQNPNDALWHGWQGLAARAILDTPEGKKLTIEKMKQIQEKHFNLDTINARLDEWIKPTKEALNTNVKKDAGNFLDGEIKGLKDRYKQRAEYMKKELPKLK